MKIDTHLHIWNRHKASYTWLIAAYGPIYADFELADVEAEVKAAGVDKCVLVQAADSYEDTLHMLNEASKYPWVGGVVGWVPLMQADVAQKKLEEFTKNPLFKGVRHLIHEEADKDWLLRDDVIEGLKVLASFNLPFDVVAVFPNQLKHVPAVAERVPNLRMVIDHLAKPPQDPAQHQIWAEQMRAAAALPQVYAKLSGLNTTTADFANWTYQDIKPNIDFAVELFGAERLMFGSDWPVAILAGTYTKVWQETNKALAGYSQAQIDAMLGGTAAKFYGVS
jgi:L-fuconolactonase